MLTLDGINLHDTKAKRVVINGAWVEVDGRTIRQPSGDNWLDPAHAEVMSQVYKLESAIKTLLLEVQS